MLERECVLLYFVWGPLFCGRSDFLIMEMLHFTQVKKHHIDVLISSILSRITQFFLLKSGSFLENCGCDYPVTINSALGIARVRCLRVRGSSPKWPTLTLRCQQTVPYRLAFLGYGNDSLLGSWPHLSVSHWQMFVLGTLSPSYEDSRDYFVLTRILQRPFQGKTFIFIAFAELFLPCVAALFKVASWLNPLD